jgi:hypothetical protein
MMVLCLLHQSVASFAEKPFTPARQQSDQVLLPLIAIEKDLNHGPTNFRVYTLI